MLPIIPELACLPLLVAVAMPSQASCRSCMLFAAAILSLPALQLIALPPAIWSALPGRAPVAEAYATAGLALPWLPISLTPASTERVMLGLLPAAALFLGVARLADDARQRLLHVAIFIGVIDVALAAMQLAGGAESPFRLYDAASRTDAVGLFANRNHHATFLAILVVMAGGLSTAKRRTAPIERVWLAAAGASLLITMAASGSRAGLMLGVGACMIVAWTVAVGRPGLRRWRSALGWSGVVATLIVIGVAIDGSAVLRLHSDAAGSDLRWQIARTTWRALVDVFPVGGGFGSFERLYARFERTEDLIPAIVNNAHDDWLEVVLEGGLPALLLLLGAVAYLVRATFARPEAGSHERCSLRIAALGALWLCALHAIVDYPLRTMSVNVLFALACGLRVRPTAVTERVPDLAGAVQRGRVPRATAVGGRGTWKGRRWDRPE